MSVIERTPTILPFLLMTGAPLTRVEKELEGVPQRAVLCERHDLRSGGHHLADVKQRGDLPLLHRESLLEGEPVLPDGNPARSRGEASTRRSLGLKPGLAQAGARRYEAGSPRSRALGRR